MKDAKMIMEYEYIKERAESLRLTVKIDINKGLGGIYVYDTQETNRIMYFETVNDLKKFIYIKSSL